MLYPDGAELPERIAALPPTDRETWRECANQIYRLKRQWGYGRWTAEESEQVASAAADRAVAIQASWPQTDECDPIPRRLHRVWFGDEIPERFEENWRTFKRLNPGWKFHTWHNPDSTEFHDTGHLWSQAKHHAQRADLVRLEILAKYGGVYVDTDVRCLKQLDPIIDIVGDNAFAGYEQGGKIIQNAVLGSPQGHPAMEALLDLTLDRFPGPTWWAGPGAVTTVFKGRADVAVYEPDAFYPLHYKEDDRWDRESRVTAASHPSSYVVHLFDASWAK